MRQRAHHHAIFGGGRAKFGGAFSPRAESSDRVIMRSIDDVAEVALREGEGRGQSDVGEHHAVLEQPAFAAVDLALQRIKSGEQLAAHAPGPRSCCFSGGRSARS